MNMKVKVLVFQLCQTLCDPVDCRLPGSSVHGIFHARIPEWIVILFSRGPSQIQGSNVGLLHFRQIPYFLSHLGRTQWTWVWANSRREWKTREPGMLYSMGSQRIRHNLMTGQQQHLCNLKFTILYYLQSRTKAIIKSFIFNNIKHI